jgi:hypothetical protein
MVSFKQMFSKTLLTLLVSQSVGLSFSPGIRANSLQLASVLGLDGDTARFNPEKVAAAARGQGSEVPDRWISVRLLLFKYHKMS